MWSPAPVPPTPSAVHQVIDALDPILVPLGFASGQGGWSEQEAQVSFCRGDPGSTDGCCLDLVVDLEAAAGWRITDVRYWGFPSESWHLDFDHAADLGGQLAGLARSLPAILA